MELHTFRNMQRFSINNQCGLLSLVLQIPFAWLIGRTELSAQGVCHLLGSRGCPTSSQYTMTLCTNGEGERRVCITSENILKSFSKLKAHVWKCRAVPCYPRLENAPTCALSPRLPRPLPNTKSVGYGLKWSYLLFARGPSPCTSLLPHWTFMIW